jgi:hypothetical protein
VGSRALSGAPRKIGCSKRVKGYINSSRARRSDAALLFFRAGVPCSGASNQHLDPHACVALTFWSSAFLTDLIWRRLDRSVTRGRQWDRRMRKRSRVLTYIEADALRNPAADMRIAILPRPSASFFGCWSSKGTRSLNSSSFVELT